MLDNISTEPEITENCWTSYLQRQKKVDSHAIKSLN